MAVHIRLSRAGAKKRPFYRIVVADHRRARGGKFLENIGTYDPAQEPAKFLVDHERLTYWRSKGALPSATLDRLIKRQARAVASPVSLASLASSASSASSAPVAAPVK